jgi:NAD+ synthase
MLNVSDTCVSSWLAFINAKNRARMACLYMLAEAKNLLMLAATNRSEWLTGLFVKYGDGAGEAAPIGHLYKTQVFSLARHIQLPRKIIDKAPSFDLTPGLCDEDMLEMPYEQVDGVLQMLVGEADNEDIAAAMNLPVKKVQFVRDLMAYSEHMRHPPATLEPRAMAAQTA